MTPYQQYLRAERMINEEIIRPALSLSHPDTFVGHPVARMDTMRAFLRRCGDPQKGIPAIHVTGTSGKGTVAALIARALTLTGLRTGLHISPYLQSATEKIQIDGRYIDPLHFADLADWVMPTARAFLSPSTPASIHGMASVAIAFEAFRRESVDVMVVEVGCGGRYDLTSFVDTEVAVITNVGLDHTGTLGPTLTDIARHKAGIARPGADLISGVRGDLRCIIHAEAAAVGCPLVEIPPVPSLPGHNEALARAAVKAYCCRRGIGAPALPERCAPLLPGRSEPLPWPDTCVHLDGAHNRDKLAFAVAARQTVPGCPAVALVGLLGTKASSDTVAPLRNQFSHLVVTEPRVYGKASCPAAATAGLLRTASCEPEIIPDPEAALNRALLLARGGTLLITGSFYLCGELRERWYSKEQVVLQQTSWPV